MMSPRKDCLSLGVLMGCSVARILRALDVAEMADVKVGEAKAH